VNGLTVSLSVNFLPLHSFAASFLLLTYLLLASKQEGHESADRVDPGKRAEIAEVAESLRRGKKSCLHQLLL
jgi:hypothetical protein